MTTRSAKQLIYGTLYAIIWLVIFAGIYFVIIRPITSAPAVAQCTPNTCAPTSTAPITTSSVSLFTTSPGHYTFLAQATNNDPDFGAPVLTYTINLYDGSGNLIESVPGQTFIYQGQQNKYLVIPNVSVLQSVDHATLEMTSAEWLASSTLGAIPNLNPQNVTASMSSSSIAVSGVLTNATIGSFETMDIIVIFNNGNITNPLGASQTELDNVQAGATNNFSVMYPVEPNIDPAQNQVIVYAL